MKKTLIILGVVVLAGFGWWTLSPLFIDRAVDDALPALDESTTENDTTPSVTELAEVVIIDTPTHPATGVVRVLETDGETIVRFENYDGTNGPDLFVYLTNDLEATEFVDLGRARGNQGNLNYTVPGDVDISDYRYVMTWCRAFSELFDYAEINPPPADS